jgi:uncharacterized DUF497 family protein
MRFDWDDRKAAANLTKHRVPFTEAATVFWDAWALDGPDVAHSHHEPRRRRIGTSERGRVLTVSYTIRGPDADAFRLISARPASRRERRAYTTAG